MKLDNKLVLLTGATGGIGEAIARQLVASGARVILIGRSVNKLEKLEKELQLDKHYGFKLEADITTHHGHETIRTALLSLQEKLDIVINCAGVNLFGCLESSSPEAIEKLINTNVTATILLTRLTLPFLHQDARVLMIGSSFGALGFPGFSTYCASKFAIRGFTEALRRELANTEIQIAYIAPRATNTSLNTDAIVKLNRALGNKMDEPEVVAEAVKKLLLRKKITDINLGWPEKLFLGINSVFPWIIDRALAGKLSIINQFAKPKRQNPVNKLSTTTRA